MRPNAGDVFARLKAIRDEYRAKARELKREAV